MTERIKPIICLEECIVALLLEVDRQILPKVVGARYGSDSDLDAPQRKVRFAPINTPHQLGAARPRSARTELHSGALRHPESLECIWVEPRLAAEIEHRAKSAQGKVRHPFFKGLRDDL